MAVVGTTLRGCPLQDGCHQDRHGGLSLPKHNRSLLAGVKPFFIGSFSITPSRGNNPQPSRMRTVIPAKTGIHPPFVFYRRFRPDRPKRSAGRGALHPKEKPPPVSGGRLSQGIDARRRIAWRRSADPIGAPRAGQPGRAAKERSDRHFLYPGQAPPVQPVRRAPV